MRGSGRTTAKIAADRLLLWCSVGSVRVSVLFLEWLILDRRGCDQVTVKWENQRYVGESLELGA